MGGFLPTYFDIRQPSITDARRSHVLSHPLCEILCEYDNVALYPRKLRMRYICELNSQRFDLDAHER